MKNKITYLILSLFFVSLSTSLSTSAAELNVATYNLLHDYPNYHLVKERLDAVAQNVQDHNIDVILIQESSDIRKLFTGSTAENLAKKLGYHSQFLVMEDLGYFISGFKVGVAIVSRYPITDVHSLVFHHQEHLKPLLPINEHRSILKATIQTPSGLVDVYTAHLTDKKVSTAAAQVVELQAFIKQQSPNNPVILGGDFNDMLTGDQELDFTQMNLANASDFNEGPQETCCQCIQKGYLNPHDTCPQTAAETMNRKIDYLFYSFNQKGILDHVSTEGFMDKPFDVGTLTDINGSDHVGILGHFILNRPSRQ